MPPWSSKIACKTGYEIRHLKKLAGTLIFKAIHLIFMQSYAKSTLILALIHTSMHVRYLGSKIGLREFHTNLRKSEFLEEQNFPAIFLDFSSFFSFFFSLLFLIYCVVFFSDHARGTAGA